MTDDEKLFRQLTRWVNSDKNKKRRIYFFALAEIIAEKYAVEVKPTFSAPLGSFEKINADGTFKLKEGVKESRTNSSWLEIASPDYQTLALVEACQNNPYSMNVKGHIGVPIQVSSLLNNMNGDVFELKLSINNILFNGLCREAKIPFELEEVDEREFAW